ncbi:MAG: FixG Ig-like domain-containing protein [Bdellovibrionales bacterium]
MAQREDLDIQVIRAVETPYETATIDDGKEVIINHFRVRVHNQSFDLALVDVFLPEDLELEMVKPRFPLQANPGQKRTEHLFVKFHKDLLDVEGAQKIQVQFRYRLKDRFETLSKEIQLIGPM